MSIEQFLFGAFGALLGATITQVYAYIRYWWNKREESRFSALLLALLLEGFASDCTGPFFELSNYANSPQHSNPPSESLPTLAEYPSVNWRNLGIKTAEALLEFRVTVRAAQNSVFGAIENANDGAAEASEQGLRLGAEADRLALYLRETFKLAPAKVNKNFDRAAFFRDELNKLEEHAAEIRRSNMLDFGFQPSQPAAVDASNAGRLDVGPG